MVPFSGRTVYGRVGHRDYVLGTTPCQSFARLVGQTNWISGISMWSNASANSAVPPEVLNEESDVDHAQIV